MTLNPVSALILSVGMLGSVGIASGYLAPADAQSAPVVEASDVLLTMPLLWPTRAGSCMPTTDG